MDSLFIFNSFQCNYSECKHRCADHAALRQPLTKIVSITGRKMKHARTCVRCIGMSAIILCRLRLPSSSPSFVASFAAAFLFYGRAFSEHNKCERIVMSSGTDGSRKKDRDNPNMFVILTNFHSPGLSRSLRFVHTCFQRLLVPWMLDVRVHTLPSSASASARRARRSKTASFAV